jgi:hypothetical protein
MRGAA